MIRLTLLAAVIAAATVSSTPAVASAAPITPASLKEAAVTSSAPGFATPDAAQAAWSTGVPGLSGKQRWLAGDGGWTVRHPYSGNVLHIFGDTAVLDSMGNRLMPHGTAVIQTGFGLRWISGPKSLIPDSTDGSIDWPGPAVWDNGKLMVFTSHIKPLSVGWEDKGKDLAQFSWDGGNGLHYNGKWITPSSGRPAETTVNNGIKYNIEWGAAVTQGKGYNWVYGTYHEAGWFGRRVYLARVPLGSLHNHAAWKYYTGQTGTSAWSPDESAAVGIISEQNGDGTEDSFSAAYRKNGFSLVSKKGGTFGADITEWRSANPWGPFTQWKIGSAPWTANFQTYLPIPHWELRPYKDGTIPLTVSHNLGSNGSLDDLFLHPEKYQNVWSGFKEPLL